MKEIRLECHYFEKINTTVVVSRNAKVVKKYSGRDIYSTYYDCVLSGVYLAIGIAIKIRKLTNQKQLLLHLLIPEIVLFSEEIIYSLHLYCKCNNIILKEDLLDDNENSMMPINLISMNTYELFSLVDREGTYNDFINNYIREPLKIS